jgi:hypothetical protein
MLQESHGSVLKNLEAHYLASEDPQSYQLVAGPVTSSDEAKRLCALLRVRKVSCTVATSFSGEPL